MPRPRVLVVGGGFAGVSLALNAAPFADVTLVSRSDYFELTWATVRSIVDKKTAEEATWNYSQMAIGTFKRGVVVSITDKEATLASGEVIPFDYAALCHGSTYPDTFAKSTAAVTRAERLKELQDKNAAIAAAKNIVVVGGGPAGVEAAAEIIEAYAGKKITLITPGKALLEGRPAKLSVHTKKWLEAHGVEVVLGERASVPEGADRTRPGAVRLTSGKEVQADLVLWCTGGGVNSDYVKVHLGSAVDANGRVKVNDKLQVDGYPNLFALGDCNNFPEPAKLGFVAAMEGELVASSIKALAAGKKSLKPHKPFNAMFVSLGRGDGAGHLNSCACTGGFIKSAKSEHLNIAKFRKQFKVK